MDREEVARARRREQGLEALEFERGRESMLRDQVAEIVTELEGARVDEAAFARMAAEDVELVRGALGGSEPDYLPAEDDPFAEGDSFEELALEDDAGSPEELEQEIARLEDELEASRRRQQAWERYLEALGG